MASKVHSYIHTTGYKMDVIMEQHEEECKWNDSRIKKRPKLPTYHSKDEDVLSQVQDSNNVRQQLNTVITPINKDSNTGIINKTSSVEVKIEKKVELIPNIERSELTLNLRSSIPKDDFNGHSAATVMETDDRINFKQVEPAVIDRFNDGLCRPTLSCAMTDKGPEIKKEIIVKSDGTENGIPVKHVESSLTESRSCSQSVGTLSCYTTNVGPEDKKAAGLDTDGETVHSVAYKKEDMDFFENSIIKDASSTRSKDNTGLDKPSLGQRMMLETDIDSEFDSDSEYASDSRSDSYTDTDTDTENHGDYKMVGKPIDVKDSDPCCGETQTNMVTTNHQSIDGNVTKLEIEDNNRKVIENKRKLNVITENLETIHAKKEGHIIEAESGYNLSGVEKKQYQICQKTEEHKTTTCKVILPPERKEKTEGSVKLSVEKKEDNVTDVDNFNVSLRELRGRDTTKVRRELKLDIPNNNNNDKTAQLDQLLLSSDMSQGIGVCCRCGEGFGTHQQIVNSNGEVWHPQCFVCAQCFQPFPEGIFYEYEGRKYCEHDFHVLFAPCCGKCGEFIVGRVIKAMNNAWHPDCFRCQLCAGPLADSGFVKSAGRALCRECNAKEKARGLGKYVCHKCHSIIEEGHIKYKGEAYHPYHFNCNTCSTELNADAREVNGELYCLRCHDKMGIPICGACRRPIEERVVHALGKAWHVEHFVCAKCEKPFFGTRHYEKKGLAYCEVHYHQLFGNICFTCNSVISGDVFHAFNKAWHVNHFACSICDRKMSQKTKFFEFDLKPVCKFCYEKFPGELKKRLKKAYEEQGSKK